MQKNKNPITDIQAQPISLHASYVVLVLFAATLVLNTVSFVIGYAAVSTGDYARYASLGRLFYVGIEKNIPTYFSGTILFSAFVLLTFIQRCPVRNLHLAGATFCGFRFLYGQYFFHGIQ